ncbi:MAG TPA: four helix bundle protein [Pyrinomonadaceae bacterium]|jgi:four helix bundle protein|nr:four helix bundle protein [Pyrinomonadaceae bacterium]
MNVNSFRDLRVWQGGMDLVERVYGETKGFPLQEVYGLTSQMRRAAVSVPSNIAEGHTREHTKEYLHHVSIAQASLAELQTQIEMAGRLHYLLPDTVGPLLDQAISLSRQLYALCNGLLKRTSSSKD